MPRGATFGDAIALDQARQAIKGETAAAKEMREAIEGRSMTQADFEGKNAGMTIIFDMPMPRQDELRPFVGPSGKLADGGLSRPVFSPPGTDDETERRLLAAP